MMPRHFIMAIVLILVGYVIGVKFPALAAKVPGLS